MMENTAQIMGAPSTAVPVTLKTLLDAGAHYGHQTHRWNPKMLPYIYGERNQVHILNLDLTLKAWEKARRAIVDALALGGNILFVGTKLQAKEIIQKESARCGAFSVTTRWLGGTLSNFETIKRSLERMRKLEDLLRQAEDESTGVKLNKKERLGISREIGKLNANIGGIRNMRKPPEVLFVVDILKEEIAIAEARRLHIPVVALVDTNANPGLISYPIPSNDDATKTIQLFSAAVADAVIEGRAIWDSRNSKDPRNSEPDKGESGGNGGSSRGGLELGGVQELGAN